MLSATMGTGSAPGMALSSLHHAQQEEAMDRSGSMTAEGQTGSTLSGAAGVPSRSDRAVRLPPYAAREPAPPRPLPGSSSRLYDASPDNAVADQQASSNRFWPAGQQ